ncbi:MAG: MarR family transcriptional regulator [Lachnospiraceae bacterium]|nr:MarR family transcriptional regulator [Lachnospiraceae bacterium]
MRVLKWLSVADRFYKIYLDKRLALFGINSSQYMFLIKICDSPGILQDSLMDIFYVHPSNIVRTIAALEKQGMLTRSPNDRDRRTWKLYPTDLALSVSEEIRIVCENTEEILLQGIGEAEKTLFLELLMQAGKNITEELHIKRKEEEFHDRESSGI